MKNYYCKLEERIESGINLPYVSNSSGNTHNETKEETTEVADLSSVFRAVQKKFSELGGSAQQAFNSIFNKAQNSASEEEFKALINQNTTTQRQYATVYAAMQEQGVQSHRQMFEIMKQWKNIRSDSGINPEITAQGNNSDPWTGNSIKAEG